MNAHELVVLLFCYFVISNCQKDSQFSVSFDVLSSFYCFYFSFVYYFCHCIFHFHFLILKVVGPFQIFLFLNPSVSPNSI